MSVVGPGQSALPPAPSGLSPTLAVARAVPLGQRVFVALGVIACCAVLAYITVLRGATVLLSFGLFGACAALLLWVGLSETLTAGEGWLARRKQFVRLDQLASVEVVRTRTGPTVSFRDRDRRYLRAKLQDLRVDPRLWELVRGGIDQSTATGLALDDRARSLFT